jgi:hypothetical protein
MNKKMTIIFTLCFGFTFLACNTPEENIIETKESVTIVEKTEEQIHFLTHKSEKLSSKEKTELDSLEIEVCQKELEASILKMTEGL